MYLPSLARQLYHNNANLSSKIYTLIHLSACIFFAPQSSHRGQSYRAMPPSAHIVKWSVVPIYQTINVHLFMRPYTHLYSTMLAATYTYHHTLIRLYTAHSHIHLYCYTYISVYIMSIYMYIHTTIVYIYIHIYLYCGEK